MHCNKSAERWLPTQKEIWEAEVWDKEIKKEADREPKKKVGGREQRGIFVLFGPKSSRGRIKYSASITSPRSVRLRSESGIIFQEPSTTYYRLSIFSIEMSTRDEDLMCHVAWEGGGASSFSVQVFFRNPHFQPNYKCLFQFPSSLHGYRLFQPPFNLLWLFSAPFLTSGCFRPPSQTAVFSLFYQTAASPSPSYLQCTWQLYKGNYFSIFKKWVQYSNMTIKMQEERLHTSYKVLNGTIDRGYGHF
jgi:hypothetical protein